MEKKNNNGVLIGLLIGIIIMLLVFVCLFATNTISLNTKTTENDIKETTNNINNSELIDEEKNTNDIDYKNIYLDYINNNKYSKENIPNEYLEEKSYIITDINSDGISELIMRFKDTTEWEYISIYTYSNNQVLLVKTLYTWSGIRYNKETNEIIYTELKTSGFGDGTRGNSLGYYKLINNKLELTRSISYIINLETMITTYHETTKNGDEIQITEEEYKEISKNEISFNYIDLE